MRRLLFILIFILPLPLLFAQNQPDIPKDPDSPLLDSNSMSESDLYIQYQRQDGSIGEGVLSGLSGTWITTLTWEGNEDQTQHILIDLVKSIRVKGYTMVRKNEGDLGIIFYFPHLFDIQMKDGTSIIAAEGRIKELESFTVYNNVGSEKVYMYFIRYWLDDQGIFNDNKSPDYNEAPDVPVEVVIFIRNSKPAN